MGFGIHVEDRSRQKESSTLSEYRHGFLSVWIKGWLIIAYLLFAMNAAKYVLHSPFTLVEMFTFDAFICNTRSKIKRDYISQIRNTKCIYRPFLFRGFEQIDLNYETQ